MAELVICAELMNAAKNNVALKPLLERAANKIGSLYSTMYDIKNCNVGSKGEKDIAAILRNVQEMAEFDLSQVALVKDAPSITILKPHSLGMSTEAVNKLIAGGCSELCSR